MHLKPITRKVLVGNLAKLLTAIARGGVSECHPRDYPFFYHSSLLLIPPSSLTRTGLGCRFCRSIMPTPSNPSKRIHCRSPLKGTCWGEWEGRWAVGCGCKCVRSSSSSQSLRIVVRVSVDNESGARSWVGNSKSHQLVQNCSRQTLAHVGAWNWFSEMMDSKVLFSTRLMAITIKQLNSLIRWAAGGRARVLDESLRWITLWS